MHLSNKNNTDKGWASMQEMLDREMPARRRKRRAFAWWWFSLLLLPLGGYGIWYFAQRAATRRLAPIAQETGQYASQPTLANTYTPTNEHLNILAATSRNRSGSMSAQLPGARYLPSDLLPLPWLPARPTAQNTRIAPAPLLHPTGFHMLDIPPTGVGPTVKQELSAPQRHKQQQPFHLGAMLGVSTETFSMLNGATLGLAVDWKKGAFGLRSGLNYNYIRPSAGERPVAALQARKYAVATGNLDLITMSGFVVDPATGQTTGATKVYLPLVRIDRFEMPLMPYVELLRRVRLFAGPVVNYTKSVQVEKVFAVNQVVSTGASDRDGQGAINGLATNELRRWQLGGQAGMGLRLGEKFELSLFYRANTIRTHSKVNFDYNGSYLEYAPQKSKINNSDLFTLNGTLFF
jgi:hypothetical protein